MHHIPCVSEIGEAVAFAFISVIVTTGVAIPRTTNPIQDPSTTSSGANAESHLHGLNHQILPKLALLDNLANRISHFFRCLAALDRISAHSTTAIKLCNHRPLNPTSHNITPTESTSGTDNRLIPAAQPQCPVLQSKNPPARQLGKAHPTTQKGSPNHRQALSSPGQVGLGPLWSFSQTKASVLPPHPPETHNAQCSGMIWP